MPNLSDIFYPVAMRPDSTLIPRLRSLNEMHLKDSRYNRVARWYSSRATAPKKFDDFLPLPTNYFKWQNKHPELQNGEISLSSSGTRGPRSSVVVNADTALAQRKAFLETISEWIGTSRRPVIFLAPRDSLEGNQRRQAKGAAISAFLQFASDSVWIDPAIGAGAFDIFSEAMSRFANEKILMFGFTSDVWNLVSAFEDRPDYSHPGKIVLFHGGGWKKLEAERVSPTQFKKALLSRMGVTEVLDYYGMVEQLGSLWIESPDGNYLPPRNSACIIRNPLTLDVCREGESGLIQTFSTIPKSYPGHSLLTDDLGKIVRNQFQPAKFGPWALQIQGRLPKLEPRGCSDAA